MSLNIGDNFKYGGKKFLDDRESFDTLEAMKNYERVPDGFITYCKENGKRYEFKSSNNIDELTGRWTEFIVNVEIPEFPEIEIPEVEINMDELYHMGEDTPENEDSVWFFTGVESASPGISLDNPLIVELLATIRELKTQVQQLQEDVEYLKINGGGSVPDVPPIEPDPEPDEPDVPVIPDDPEEDDDSIFKLIMEDDSGGFLLEDESGSLILEESVFVDKVSNFLLEDGFNLLLEDGDLLLFEEQEVIVDDKKSNITLENGFDLLLEDGSLMLLESSIVEGEKSEPSLLMEDGDNLLLENGYNILMER